MYFIYPVCFTRKSPLSPINNGSTLCHSRHMQAASKSWREKLKCYFLHSHSSWFRQTESARGRLIAVEIEAERLSFFLFFLKLSVLKVMCRYFHIWHTKGGTVTRLFFVGFFSLIPSSSPVSFFRKCQLTHKLRRLFCWQIKHLIKSLFFLPQNLFFLCFLFAFVSLPLVRDIYHRKSVNFVDVFSGLFEMSGFVQEAFSIDQRRTKINRCTLIETRVINEELNSKLNKWQCNHWGKCWSIILT